MLSHGVCEFSHLPVERAAEEQSISLTGSKVKYRLTAAGKQWCEITAVTIIIAFQIIFNK